LQIFAQTFVNEHLYVDVSQSNISCKYASMYSKGRGKVVSVFNKAPSLA